MNSIKRALLTAFIALASMLSVHAQHADAGDSELTASRIISMHSLASLSENEKDKKARPDGDKAASDERDISERKASAEAPSVSPTVDAAIFGTMLQVLLARGVISPEEARAISARGSVVEQRNHLASMLLARGVITATDYAAIVGANPTNGTAANANAALASAQQNPPSQRPSEPNPNQINRPAPPAVIPAVAPSRPLQVEATKRESIIPDIKLGNNIRLKLNGFMKSSVIYDSTNPGGNDFPTPLLSADTGPKTDGQFRIKARSFRIGGTFEGLDPSPRTSIIGRFELDFEGLYSTGGSSFRNLIPRLRFAFVRIDHRTSDATSFFALFGQDWTPFAGSTLPNTIETTGLGSGWGNPYDRLPQVRAGLDHNFGGARAFHLAPEFAITLPKYSIAPTDLATQLTISEREGTDSRRPEIQGRIVAQFVLDDAPGVPPAQLIGSFMQGERRAIVTAANVPAAFKSAFPNGAEVTSDRYGLTAEASLPTRFMTLSMKYYSGSDLASFNGSGQSLTTFNETAGLSGLATVTTLDGRTVVFGFRNGQPVVADQRSVRARGGFVEIGIPLSRLFDADPKGRWAGFDANFHYGYDQATPRDARHAGSNRGKSDWTFANVRYKFNSFITFAFEQGYFRTRAINNSPTDFGGLPLLRGIPARASHDNRSEFATIFTF